MRKLKNKKLKIEIEDKTNYVRFPLSFNVFELWGKIIKIGGKR